MCTLFNVRPFIGGRDVFYSSETGSVVIKPRKKHEVQPLLSTHICIGQLAHISNVWLA